MATDWFTFQARLDRVIDGDTMDLVVDLGFRTRKTIRVRVTGVDTDEIYGVSQDSEEYRRGQKHSAFARAWFDEHTGDGPWPFVLSTEKDHGKYGRWPARITSKATRHVYNEDVVEDFPEVGA